MNRIVMPDFFFVIFHKQCVAIPHTRIIFEFVRLAIFMITLQNISVPIIINKFLPIIMLDADINEIKSLWKLYYRQLLRIVRVSHSFESDQSARTFSHKLTCSGAFIYSLHYIPYSRSEWRQYTLRSTRRAGNHFQNLRTGLDL